MSVVPFSLRPQPLPKDAKSDEVIRAYNDRMAELRHDFAILQPVADQVFNVRHFGAVGNGVTDDTAAIQAAITAASAAGGGTVYLPVATYRITSALAPVSSVWIRGDGVTSRIVQATSGQNIFSGTSVSNCAITNLRASGYGAGGTANGIRLESATRALIRDVWVDEASLHGIFLLTCALTHIRDCHISDWNGATNSGANLQSCTDSTVSGCEIHGGAWIGINLDICVECRAFDNTIYDNGHSGVNVYNAALRNIVANNTVRDLTGGSGIVVDGGSTDEALDNLVIGNVVDNTPTRGISTRQSSRTAIVGNIVRLAAQHAGIYVHDTVSSPLISGNTVLGCTDSGIRIAGTTVTNAAIVGNLCRSNGQRGIWTSNNFTLITGNSCYDNGTEGIYVPAGNCVVSGNHCLDNSQTTPGADDGISVGNSRCVVTGNFSGNTAAAGSQRYGLNITGGSYTRVSNNMLLNNASGDLVDGGTATLFPGRLVADGWYYDNLGTGVAATEMTRAVGRFRPVRAGFLLGVIITSTVARTAGTCTATVWKKSSGLSGAAGATTGLAATLNGTNVGRAATSQDSELDSFIAGDELFVKLESDGSWAPTTADIRVAIEIED